MKKKILAICMIAAMAATAAISGTLAYFSDTDDQTNTFTTGALTITLDEAVVGDTPDAEGNLVATSDRTEDDQAYKLFPGMTVDKDPTITLDEGSEDAYIASIVTITGNEGLYDLYGIDGYDTLNIHDLVSGGLVDDEGVGYTTWNGLFCYETEDCYIHQVANKAEGEWQLFIFMKKAFKANDTVTLFENMNIDPAYNNDEMAILKDLSIEVDAYGVQTVGFDDCYAAMTGAYAADFSF